MIETSPTIGAIAAALAKAQAQMGGAKKDANNSFFNSSYADLESVTEAIRKPATDGDLSWTQGGGLTPDGLVSVTTLVMHKSGEWIKNVVTSRPKDAGPQSVGSCITYNRRYGLQSAFGLWTTDDDGNAAQGNTKAPVALDPGLMADLEAVADQGMDEFKKAWKNLSPETRKAVQESREWFESLKARAGK